MPKPPAKLVELIALVSIVVAPVLFLLGSYWFTLNLIHLNEDSMNSLGVVIGGFLIVVSLMLFGTGGAIMNFNRSIYKIVLPTAVVILILLFIVGGLGLI